MWGVISSSLDKQNYAEYCLAGTLPGFITAIAGGLVKSGKWAGWALVYIH